MGREHGDAARRAIERIGPFDEALGGAGDEEDWQRRLRAAGGRVGYVAAAGVDHRRAGRDAQLRSLARAAVLPRPRRAPLRRLPRPRARARAPSCGRWPAASGTSCAAAAASAIDADARSRSGRLAEALDPAPAPPSATDPDYLSGRSGTLGRRGALVGAAKDLRARRGRPARPARARPRGAPLADAARARRRRRAARAPAHGRAAAARARALAATTSTCTSSRPRPAPASGPTSTPRSRAAPAGGADWLLIVDDDVVLPRGFLDRFLAAAEAFGLELAQPAHAFASHAAWDVTRRRPGVLARRTRFVEIGPVTALSARAAARAAAVPGPAHGLGPRRAPGAPWPPSAAGRSAIVDATPVRHLRPVAAHLPARRGDRRGRGVPRRPRLRDPRRGRGDRCAEYREAASVKVAVVAEYYPRAADPALGVWAHRQALATRATPARRSRCFVLHRPVPSKAALRARDAEGADRAAAPAAAHRARRAEGHLRAVRRAAAPALVRVLGRVGGADARARAAQAASTSSTPTTPRPPGDAVRRARATRRS